MNRNRTMIARTVTLFSMLLPVALPGLAADRHVAVSGNDNTGAGTAAAPWRTVTRAVAAAEPGDVIILHPGEYADSVRIVQPNITLMSAEGARATIRSPIFDGDSPRFAVMFDVDASGGTLRGLELIGGYYAVFLQTRFDWGEANRNGASDILIEDCVIHESGRDCIKITPNSDRVTIRRCEIYNSGQMYPPGTPSENKNAEGIDVTNGDAILVQDCYIHDTATTGVYFKGGATNCVVERTRVERCGAAGILLGFDTSPEFFDLEANPQYYECENAIARNCIVRDTNYAGIGVYAAKGALIANNTVINTARVGHSPIYFGVTLQDYVPEAGRPASVDVRVLNNIVVQADSANTTAVFIRYLFEPELGGLSALAGMPTMRNNLYYVAGGTPVFSDRRPTSELLEGDLTAWKAHFGGETGSFSADPLLANDGKLTAGSPAIGRGAAVAGVIDDFDGQTRPPSGTDIGADQFAADGPVDDPKPVEPVDPTPIEPNPVDPPVVEAPADAPPTNSPPIEDRTPRGGDRDGVAADDSSDREATDLPSDISGAAGLCPATAIGSLALSMVGLGLTSRQRRMKDRERSR